MLEQKTKVSPKVVWQAWQQAYQVHSEGPLAPGARGKTKKEGAKGFRYQILEVKEGESFSILWKSYFTKLIFTHKVMPLEKGSLVQYGFSIRGPFAWPLRWCLKKKLHKSLSHVLRAFILKLET